VRITADAHALAVEAAGCSRSRLGVGGGRGAHLGLSGGSTRNRSTGSWLLRGRRRPSVGRTHLIWGDERCVPAADAESSYGSAASTSLLGWPGLQCTAWWVSAPESSRSLRGGAEGFWTGSPGRHRVDTVLLGLAPTGAAPSSGIGVEREARWVVSTEPSRAASIDSDPVSAAGGPPVGVPRGGPGQGGRGSPRADGGRRICLLPA
jgi:hypothetical protein